MLLAMRDGILKMANALGKNGWLFVGLALLLGNHFYLMLSLFPVTLSSYVEALMYLIYSYQYNNELVSKGPNRGHDEAFLSHFRRECLLVSTHIYRFFYHFC